MKDYIEFIKSKVKIAPLQGFELDIDLVNPNLKPHNKIMVKWLVEGCRRACAEENVNMPSLLDMFEVEEMVDVEEMEELV